MKNKIVLITGGTGSWASGLIYELLKEGVAKIKVYARNEHKMVELLREFSQPQVDIIIGDIRDKEALSLACRGVDVVYHLAALKHVPICEEMPFEAIETNIIGTKNVIDAAVENGVTKVIYASTDKAVNPDCSYGSTKMLGEKLVLSANTEQNKTRFIVFRGGNLTGSAGSVIPLFKEQIKERGEVTLTDERMSRFFISIEKASKLMVEVSKKAMGGEIFIPNMPAINIKDIGKYLLIKNGLPESNILITGPRPGEKLSEELLSDNEKSFVYKDSDQLFVISRNSVTQRGEKASDFSSISNEGTVTYADAAAYLIEAGV